MDTDQCYILVYDDRLNCRTYTNVGVGYSYRDCIFRSKGSLEQKDLGPFLFAIKINLKIVK